MKITDEFIHLLKNNQQEEALTLLFEAIEKEPKNDVHYINAGNLLFDQRLYEQAERFFLKAIELNKEAATAYFSLGSLYYETEHYEQAEQLLKHALHLQMEDQDVYYLLGMTYVKQNNYLLALPFLQRAQELGENIHVLFQYGLALAKVNYFSEAEDIFLRVLEIDGNYVDALYNLGILYIHQDKLEEGKNYLQKTLQLNPNHSLALDAIDTLKR